ncbi:MAG: hypothetical protein RL701_1596 [Pseudomonadota bacterium]|jgi:hypothetical protein
MANAALSGSYRDLGDETRELEPSLRGFRSNGKLAEHAERAVEIPTSEPDEVLAPYTPDSAHPRRWSERSKRQVGRATVDAHVHAIEIRRPLTRDERDQIGDEPSQLACLSVHRTSASAALVRVPYRPPTALARGLNAIVAKQWPREHTITRRPMCSGPST